MILLTLRTDKPEAEIGLYEDGRQLTYSSWLAHRQLAETLHLKLAAMLADQATPLEAIQGIAIYRGPGSFTGLRIGFSVANALAGSLEVPIVAGSGDNWREDAIGRLLDGQNETIVLPEYGSPPHITQPKH